MWRGTIEAVRVVQALIIVIVILVTAAVAMGWGDRMVSVPVDRAPAGLPADADVSAADIPALRFNMALRGYRMAEVDRVLAQLADALASRDNRIAELQAARDLGGDRPGEPPPGPDPGRSADSVSDPAPETAADG